MKRILIGLLLAVACVNLAWADGELRPALAMVGRGRHWLMVS